MTRATILLTSVLGAGVLAATVLQARGPANPEPAGTPGTTPATTGRVAAEGRVVTYPGGEVVVGNEWPGRLVRVAVEEGATVRRGDLLAELDSDELRASLAEARARVTETDAEVLLAEVNLRRRQDLANQQIVAKNDLDQAERDLSTTRARRETARATSSRFEAQLRKTRILAPIAGTVIARHVHAGETLETGKRVVTLADLRRLRIEAEADEADAGALSLGVPVAITCAGFPGQAWRGTVEEIPDSVTLRRLRPQDPSRPTDIRILAVKVAFAEPNPLKLGTTVELRIGPGGR